MGQRADHGLCFQAEGRGAVDGLPTRDLPSQVGRPISENNVGFCFILYLGCNLIGYFLATACIKLLTPFLCKDILTLSSVE